MPGGHIQLVSLTKRFTDVAVDDIDLTVDSGEFFSLLGPSGCGKTTTLRLIAGFEQPTSGRILLDGADMSGVPPHKRNVNTVFQSYALFPFLTVFDNVAFGLRNRSWTRARPPAGSTRRWTWSSCARSRSAGLGRCPAASSSGWPWPGPWCSARRCCCWTSRSARWTPSCAGRSRWSSRRSQERVGITFLYVTHDQEEALTMSDRLAVMNSGQDRADRRPAAGLRGARGHVCGRLPRRVEPDAGGRRRARPGRAAAASRLGESALDVERGDADGLGTAHAVIRPERVRIEEHGSAGPNRVPAMVERLVFLGAATQVMLRLAAGAQLQALVQNDGGPPEHLAQGTPVHVFLAPDALRVLRGTAADVAPADDELAVS